MSQGSPAQRAGLRRRGPDRRVGRSADRARRRRAAADEPGRDRAADGRSASFAATVGSTWRYPRSSWSNSCSASPGHGPAATLSASAPGGVRSRARGPVAGTLDHSRRKRATWLVEMFGSLQLSRVKSASDVTTKPTRASGTIRSGFSCASTAAGAGATRRTARRADLTGALRGPQPQTRQRPAASPAGHTR